MVSTAEVPSTQIPWIDWPTSPRHVYRLTSARFHDRAFEGEGARRYGGRWNHRGIAVVYASQSLSLACLETLVHVEPETLPDDLIAVSARLPASLPVLRVERSALPEGWRRYPSIQPLKDLGTRWAREKASAVLAVPSAVIPQEWNFLINPNHPEFSLIEPPAAEVFTFDARLMTEGAGVS